MSRPGTGIGEPLCATQFSNDVCGAGKHNERIEHPEVPKSEWHPNDRVKAMREVAQTEEDLFEVAAAEHNIADG